MYTLRKKMNKQKGHEGDVERLIEEHQPQLKAFIHRRVSSKEDAEDILQDVFYQLVKAVSNTLNPIAQVTSWLYRVTRNTIINKEKKKSEEEWPVSAYAEEESVLSEFSEVLFANDDLAPSPETEYMRSLVWQELEAALGELPAEQRAVLHLLYANTVNRGGPGIAIPNSPFRESRPIEVVEELLPLRDVEVSVKLGRPVRSVRLVPQGTELPYREKEGRISFTVPELLCHQMVEFAYR